MPAPRTLRIAALVDLPRTAQSGGHVKYWERLAQAAAPGDLPLELTVFFSGKRKTEVLGPGARMIELPPVLSTAQLRFLPYVPDHTDLSPYHPALARALAGYDAFHTTDAFFAFARTAESLARRRGVPLVTSIHTDTPAYTRIFTRHTIERRFGEGWPKRKLIDDWNLPERQGRRMDLRLARHLRRCAFAAATRAEDHALAAQVIGEGRVGDLRLGVDKTMFGPHRADRAGVRAELGLADGAVVALFVGRLDVGKNVHTLVEALARLKGEAPAIHLVAAGVGPAAEEIRGRLGASATVAGYVAPDALARLYASADLVALSSEVETGSMVAVEALASGCPVLVSTKSGVADLFDATPAMRTVEAGARAWTEALRALAGDADGQAAMRTAALAYAARKLAPWREVLESDLLPLWGAATEQVAPAKLIA
ncbi:MAG: glycosyltransferase [Caulobacteraceae bacterium]